VRVLASLSHPNIVQYHCAWLESVPIETRTRQASSLFSQTKKPILVVKQQDSFDEVIQFEGQSLSDNKAKSLQKSSTSQEDDSENSVFESIGKSKSRQSHSDGDNPSKSVTQHSAITNRELIPFQTTNQLTHAKIVLFIQMQLCDTTLYDWLRYRDNIIIEETSETQRKNFYTLNDIGQNQCSNIFKQLLTAVEVNNTKF
jgi:hypothetical protein